jgi:hypothetical protein
VWWSWRKELLWEASNQEYSTVPFGQPWSEFLTMRSSPATTVLADNIIEFLVSLRIPRACYCIIEMFVGRIRNPTGVRRRSEAHRSSLRWPYQGGAVTTKLVALPSFDPAWSRIRGTPWALPPPSTDSPAVSPCLVNNFDSVNADLAADVALVPTSQKQG